MSIPTNRIMGLGLACPVGLARASAEAALRAGISRIVENDAVAGPTGPVRAMMLSTLDSDAGRAQRVFALARHALAEALEPHQSLLRQRPVPCFLSLPAPGVGPAVTAEAATRELSQVALPSGERLSLVIGPNRCVSTGRAGAFEGLRAALDLLSLGREPYCVVGGIDSKVDPQTLAGLVAGNRLLTKTNPDGILPSEGAGFVLLGTPAVVARRDSWGRVVANHVAQEAIPFDAEGPKVSPSLGLSAVFRALRSHVQFRVDEVSAGVTGQVYYGREFSHAYLRNAELMPEPLVCRPLADELGDVGAASGAIALVRAVTRLRTFGSTAGVQHVLAYASSESGRVGGCVVGPC